MSGLQIFAAICLVAAPLSIIGIALFSRINRFDLDDDGPTTIIIPPAEELEPAMIGDMPDVLDVLQRYRD